MGGEDTVAFIGVVLAVMVGVIIYRRVRDSKNRKPGVKGGVRRASKDELRK